MGIGMKPGIVSGLPPVPFIRLGEVKNVRSYGKGLRQLSLRDARGNTALALYDNGGNVWLQVFGHPASPNAPKHLIYDRLVGRVTLPRAANGAPIRPGTAPFGNAIEPKVMDLIAMVTGQRFRAKRANAGGPDLVAREMAMELESEALSEVIERIVQAGRAYLQRWRATPATSRGGQVQRAKALNELAQRALNVLLQRGLSDYEIRILIGTFYGLEAAIRPVAAPYALQRFREVAGQQLRLTRR